MQSTEFPLAPYSISLFYIIAVVVGLMLAGLFTLFFTVGYGFNHITTNVGPDGLEFKGIFYGEKFPKSKLKVGEARPVDLDGADSELSPEKRMGGLGMSQLTYGKWKLKNG